MGDKKRSWSRSLEKALNDLPTENLLDLTRKAVMETTKSGQDLPSASDYSDLDSPAGSPGPQVASVISRTDKAGSLRCDILEQTKRSAKKRLGRKRGRETKMGEEEKCAIERKRGREAKIEEEEKSAIERKSEEVVVVKDEDELRRKVRKANATPNQTYFAKILGDLKKQGQREGGLRRGDERKKGLENSPNENKDSEVVYDNMRREASNPVKGRLGTKRDGEDVDDGSEEEKERRVKSEVRVKKSGKRKLLAEKVSSKGNDLEEERPRRKKKKSDKSIKTKAKGDSSTKPAREAAHRVSKKGIVFRKGDVSRKGRVSKEGEVSKDEDDDSKPKNDDSKGMEELAKAEEGATYAPVGSRKIKLRQKPASLSLSSTPVKMPRLSDLKSPAGSRSSRLSESLTLDDSIDLVAGGSQACDNDGEDVMKQLDDFINE